MIHCTYIGDHLLYKGKTAMVREITAHNCFAQFDDRSCQVGYDWTAFDPKEFDLESKVINVVYDNHRGLVQVRRIIPIDFRFGSTTYYPDPQWLVDVFDWGKMAYRTYALAKIRAWGIK